LISSYLIRYGLGYLFYRQEKYQLAEFHYRKAQKINQGNPLLTCYIGMVSIIFGKKKKIFFLSYIYYYTILQFKYYIIIIIVILIIVILYLNLGLPKNESKSRSPHHV